MMRRGTARVALVLTVALAGAAAWDGSQRKPLPAATGTSLQGQAPGLASGDDELTVLQFNIHRGAPADGEENLAATASCLKDVELAGLNEVGGEEQALTLGETLGLGWLFIPSERRWWHEHFGNGLLSALPLEAWQRRPLAHAAARGYRSRLEATLDWHGRDVMVLVTHLDSGPDRDLQLEELARRFAALPAPKILLGDLNAKPEHPVIAAWRADPALVVTSGEAPGTAPGGVDWIVAAGFQLVAAWRCDQGASDHPAVGARLERRF